MRTRLLFNDVPRKLPAAVCSILVVALTGHIRSAELPLPPEPAAINHYIAIDNVCAWPNLSRWRDGTIAAVIHNKVHHGRMFGALDCWVSEDGQFWEKRSVPVPNDPFTVRMNHAAGLADNGDLIVLCSGWRNAQTPWTKLPVAVARSTDKGQTWTNHTHFPLPGAGWTDFVPFGSILKGDDGALHVSCYAGQPGGQDENFKSWFLSSRDDGNTWNVVSVIGQNNNETTILHLGGNHWIAGARRNAPPEGSSRDTPIRVVDLYSSNDNGASWQGPAPLTNSGQHPCHLLLLDDGQVLLTYGNRSNAEGGTGVLAKLSRDKGKTWSAPLRIAQVSGDLGYPSSVQRDDGKIVTAYYSSGIGNHQRYFMGVAIWEAPPSAPAPKAVVPANSTADAKADRGRQQTQSKYSIGDFAQGGIVFWVDDNGQHGLVCAKADQSHGARWFQDPRGFALAKASDHYLGAGRKNTETILAAQAAIGDKEATSAARICSDLQISQGGVKYDGWFLPSIRELNQMYIHRATINAVAKAHGGAAFAALPYWSSTQCTGEQAWIQDFRNGTEAYYAKSFSYRVRAVRKF